MSFILEALRDKPLALYAMSDTSPFQDYSGYGRTATATGTPATHAALAKGLTLSTILTNTTPATFESPVFNQGYEAQSFSLEAWVRVISPDGNEQQILGNSGRMDGLLIEGTVISFTTKYSTAPEARVSYDTQQAQKVHAVGVHTENKNSLYVNGVLVAETSLTEEQQADTFAATSPTLHGGATTGTQQVAVNGIGIYATALTTEAVSRHYLIGNNVLDETEVQAINGGDTIPLSLSNADIFLDQWWSTESEWREATLQGVAVLNDKLVPEFESDISLAGYWMDTVVLSSANATSIYGVTFDWDGEGAVVEVSLDMVAWEPVTRGQRVATIPANFDPTDKELMVRVSFPGGIENDTSYMDNLNAIGIRSASNTEVAGRVITYTAATPNRSHPPFSYHDNWGVDIATGGSVSVSADTTPEATPLRSLEFWIKRTTATNPVVSVTGTTYINGAAGSATLPVGQWVLMHVVAAANVTTGFTITGPAQVGTIGIYDTALSAAKVTEIYNEYVGNSSFVVTDNASIAVEEPAVGPQIYAHDWSIQASG